MKAYRTIKFIEAPDVGDIGSQGRKTSVGRIKRGETYTKWLEGSLRMDSDGRIPRHEVRVKHNDRGYNKPTVKAAVRRSLKRKDKAATAKIDFEE